MDTTFLQNFIEVVEEGSIAKVARRAGLTPAAINLRIRRVEEELGFKLITRAGRTISPTPEGAQILVQARRVIEEVRSLRCAHGPMVFGYLTLGAFDSAMVTLGTGLMGRLVKRYPNLEINLVKGYSVHLYGQVCDGEIDAAIVLRPNFQMPKNIEWRPIHDEPLVVLVPEALRENDAHQILRANPLICYDRKLWGGQMAADYLRQHNIHPKVRIETAAVEVICRLVSRGLGVSLVPDCIDELSLSAGLRKIALPNTPPFRSIGLLWNRQSARVSLLNEIHGMLLRVSESSQRVSSTPITTVD